MIGLGGRPEGRPDSGLPTGRPGTGERLGVQPRTLLVVTNLYPGGLVPGRGVFVERQVESLRRAGHDVDVVAIDGARGRFEYVRGVKRMRAALRRRRYDLVHAHYGFTGIVARLQRAAPLVVSFAGSDLMLSWQRPLSRFAAREADFCVVKSAALRDVVRVGHCVVIPSGTDLERFQPVDPVAARRELGWNEEDVIALFPWDPSRPEKDFALAQAAVDAANAELAGLPARVRMVTFHGRPEAEYGLALNAADLCLLTSRYEGSPNAVREALAVGLPVVAVDAGDASAVIAGIDLCASVPRQPASIGRAVAEVARRRLTLQEAARGSGGASPPVPMMLRHGGRDRMRAFSLETVARKLSLLYEGVLAGRRDGVALQGELDALDSAGREPSP